MPIINIDGINIRYGKEKHLPNHFDVANQFRNWLQGKTSVIQSFTIWNKGEPDYIYVVECPYGKWNVETRQVWITDKVFKNVISKITAR